MSVITDDVIDAVKSILICSNILSLTGAKIDVIKDGNKVYKKCTRHEVKNITKAFIKIFFLFIKSPIYYIEIISNILLKCNIFLFVF